MRGSAGLRARPSARRTYVELRKQLHLSVQVLVRGPVGPVCPDVLDGDGPRAEQSGLALRVEVYHHVGPLLGAKSAPFAPTASSKTHCDIGDLLVVRDGEAKERRDGVELGHAELLELVRAHEQELHSSGKPKASSSRVGGAGSPVGHAAAAKLGGGRPTPSRVGSDAARSTDARSRAVDRASSLSVLTPYPTFGLHINHPACTHDE